MWVVLWRSEDQDIGNTWSDFLTAEEAYEFARGVKRTADDVHVVYVEDD